MAAAVSPEDLPLLAPRKRLTGRLIAAPNPSISLVGQSLFWGGIVRIDVLEVSLFHSQ
jgi:nitric-oxide synthase